jgi:hypothetical protein
MRTRYEYAVYNRTESRRIGVLPNVTSPFNYNQLINTPGTAIEITVGIDPSFDRFPPDRIMTEASEYITTEEGDILTTEEYTPIFDRFENFRNDEIVDPYYFNFPTTVPLIRNGNFIRVFEFSDRNPNGLKVFEGEMKRVKLSYSQKNIKITALSFGYTLQNYMIRGIGTIDRNNSTSDSSVEIYYTDSTHLLQLGQSFTTGGSVTNLFSIVVRCAALSSEGAQLTVKVYSASTFDIADMIGVGSVIVTDTAVHDEEVIINPELGGETVVAATTYYFSVETQWPQGEGITIYYNSGGNTYSGGTMYVNKTDPETFAAVPVVPIAASSDLYFMTTYSDTNLSKTAGHATKDQGAMFRSIIADYIANFDNLYDWVFGIMNFGVIELTGTSYRFDWNTATILEGLEGQRKLAPATYYWYGSVADSTLNFRETNTAADHVFVKGKHLGEVDIEFSTEDIKNIAYLIGGEVTPGVNLFKTKENAISRNNHPRGLVILTDNRITTDETATAYLDNALGQIPGEVHSTSIEVFENTYDINTIEVGQTVGFVGYNAPVGDSVIQIVGKNRKERSVVLQLGQNPVRQNQLTEKALRDLEAAQTINNPDEPEVVE